MDILCAKAVWLDCCAAHEGSNVENGVTSISSQGPITVLDVELW